MNEFNDSDAPSIDQPVSEINERFLQAILRAVPLERVEELHLFAPLRQGGVETGIAVIAARAPVAAEEVREVETSSPADVEAQSEAMIPVDEQNDVVVASPVDDDIVIDAPSPVDAFVDALAGPAFLVEPEADDSPYASDALHDAFSEALAESVPVAPEAPGPEAVAPEPPAAPEPRHTVYTARYRLVQKGPDRGKWETTIVDEADAPLITVEMVVRGVQRRAGDATGTTRYSAAQLAHVLRYAH